MECILEVLEESKISAKIEPGILIESEITYIIALEIISQYRIKISNEFRKNKKQSMPKLSFLDSSHMRYQNGDNHDEQFPMCFARSKPMIV